MEKFLISYLTSKFMKRLYIANWKMKMAGVAIKKYVTDLKKLIVKDAQLVLAPSFPYLSLLAKSLEKSAVQLAAQDVASWKEGAYTGEVSAAMIKENGGKFVIVGHSERREYFGETNKMIGEKLNQAMSVGLTPIWCVGETAADRRQGLRDQVLVRQIKESLAHVELGAKSIIIAYEPVWAISTSGVGMVVTPSELESAYKTIKRAITMVVSEKYFKDKVKFIYGGSVNAANIVELKALDYIEGFLVGGASLKVKDFASLIQA